MDKQTFSLGQILSVTTGVLCCHGMSEMYKLLNFMTQSTDAYDISAGRIAREVTPYLLEQHPQLAEITKESLAGREEFWKRFQPFIDKYGDSFECMPMHLEDHEDLDPIEELARHGVGPKNITIISLDED